LIVRQSLLEYEIMSVLCVHLEVIVKLR
jgi:hypothetical protein